MVVVAVVAPRPQVQLGAEELATRTQTLTEKMVALL
jgi:hypothetical protein